MNTTETNPFTAMLERLDGGKNWMKGDIGYWNSHSGKVCLRGACYSVLGVNNPMDLLGIESQAEVLDLILVKIIKEQFPDRYQLDPGTVKKYYSVPRFNDHDDTVFADIRLVLEKCAGVWDEQHG